MSSWNPDGNDVYYRVMRGHGTDEPIVACMQWFDEHDCDHDRYLTDERFQHEEDAQAFIQEISTIGISREEARIVRRIMDVFFGIMGDNIDPGDLRILAGLALRIDGKWPR